MKPKHIVIAMLTYVAVLWGGLWLSGSSTSQASTGTLQRAQVVLSQQALTAAPTTRLYRSVPVKMNRTTISQVSPAANFELIPAQTGPNLQIQVWEIKLSTSTNTNLKFKSGSNNLTGAVYINPVFLDPPERAGVEALPRFETNAGENFSVDIGDSTGLCGGEILWTAMPGS